MKIGTLKVAVLFLGAAMLPLPTAFMGTGLVTNANATTATNTITVSASVPNNCNFIGGSVTLVFGSYDPVVANASTNKDSSTTFQFRCTKGGSAALALNLGSNASGSVRRMISGSEYLNYELYSDAGRSSIWGSSASTDVDATFPTSSNPQTFTVYGRIPFGQDVSVGNYSDTVTITATF